MRLTGTVCFSRGRLRRAWIELDYESGHRHLVIDARLPRGWIEEHRLRLPADGRSRTLSGLQAGINVSGPGGRLLTEPTEFARRAVRLWWRGELITAAAGGPDP